MRVLIVDDEVQIAMLLREVLEWEEYEVRVAGNGRQAIDVLASFRPDVIVSDVMMPVMNGIELCKSLAAHPMYQTIPIILASAGRQSSIAHDCPHAAFLAKPFNFSDLLATIARVTGSEPDR